MPEPSSRTVPRLSNPTLAAIPLTVNSSERSKAFGPSYHRTKQMSEQTKPALRKLGNSDLEITPLGIGAWAMGGGGWAFAWGPQDDQESIAAIHAALDRGINWIDTAAVYGLGHSEEVVARALEGRSKKPYVFTK